MKFSITLVLFLLVSTSAISQSKNLLEWGLAINYGPQLSFFNTGQSAELGSFHKRFGTKKSILGVAYGADLELRKPKWIFGVGYSFCENKKRYKKEEMSEPFQDAYSMMATLRYTEKGFFIYADRKINKAKKNELFAGLGLLFSRGDNQMVEIFYAPNDLHSASIYSYPSVEGGVIGRFKWQHSWKKNVSFGMQAKIHFLYSVGALSNFCVVPYVKIKL